MRNHNQLGDILVVPEGTENPYKVSIIGDTRRDLLKKFFLGGDTTGYEFWHAPTCGGAKKVASAAEANVNPDVVTYYWGGNVTQKIRDPAFGDNVATMVHAGPLVLKGSSIDCPLTAKGIGFCPDLEEDGDG